MEEFERWCLMTLGLRKLVVTGVIGFVFLLANLLSLAHWLSRTGMIDWAQWMRREYVTGTAITVILALLFLLASPRVRSKPLEWVRRCPVCDQLLLRKGRYCPECGSRV